MFTALTLSALVSLTPSARYADTDNDGLLDVWESDGFGPIDPKVHGCSPSRPDVFILFRIRSTMNQAKIQPTIDRMKRFYAELPYKNADGSTGLNMIAIVPPPMPADTDKKGYIELYHQAMPEEWRGLAHGILVDDHPGGGGQANRPDWCGTGYNWMTMLHELGHQFGLPHEPVGARTGSPFHPSMMNYDYSYQLGGKGEAIQFSTGKFLPMRMKETALNERVPFPQEEVAFLSSRPYYFKTKKIDDKMTAIDWNRNGVFGEKRVRADVNDGYAAGYRGSVRLEFSCGSSALAAMGSTLVVAYPDLSKPEDYKTWAFHSLSREKPGKLQVQLVDDGKAGKAQTIVAEGVCGDPTAVADGKLLWVSHPTSTGYSVHRFRKKGVMVKSVASQSYPVGKVQPTLVHTPQGVLALVWDETSQSVSVQTLSGEGTQDSLPQVTSQFPVGAVWNSKKKCLAVVTPVQQGDKKGRVRINHLRHENGAWKLLEQIWVEGEKGGAATSWRPQIIFDASKDRGPEGAYNIYMKGGYADPHQGGLNYLCRQIADKSIGDGWRVKMIGNEWANSRSACAVTPYKGDIAYAARWHAGVGGAEDGRLGVALRASGVEDEWLTDFDEVGFIFKQGLRDSLRAVQIEQWRRRK